MSERVLRFQTSSEEATLQLGRALGMLLVPGTTVLLSGDLGAGKTTLVRGIGDALGATRVRSPSFTLIKEHPTSSFILVHVDLYRLEPEEVKDLGLEEYLDGREKCVLLVEWAERWRAQPARDVVKIVIELKSENDRFFEVSSKGEKANMTFHHLREDLERNPRFAVLS
jgi:tRNA threonylcarbamoyladenosine biosynthesis protein TsaE